MAVASRRFCGGASAPRRQGGPGFMLASVTSEGRGTLP